jgi:hypothetical protein
MSYTSDDDLWNHCKTVIAPFKVGGDYVRTSANLAIPAVG